MKIQGHPWRTVWLNADAQVEVIDQRFLPHELKTAVLPDVASFERAIREMWIRGAPLIGVVAAYGLAVAMRHDSSDTSLLAAQRTLLATRPTAVNLQWGLARMVADLLPRPPQDRVQAAFALAAHMADEDVSMNHQLGLHGLALIREVARRKPGQRIHILTHCNAGWLATVDWGTATSAIYQAYNEGIDVHVWVDETRPRNQGASLTAWELGQHGVPHTLIVDNAGGHLMQHGQVDMCIVGTDRVTARGDVCNKIGTYLKALAAHDNNVPFYVAMPSPTLDLSVHDGVREIPIEDRAGEEISHMTGLDAHGYLSTVQISPTGTPTNTNPGFDVTPARLVTALITDRGLCAATPAAIAALFGPQPQPHFASAD
ncbi:S-methyl-5-thioribose-1-phosphate isomerase [Rhodoferax antarcticus]|uniref:S-methyl-5-thioribose-1-phosphate isomerase n=1 Tax=Rhodoferax antarcticus TaxID=81479 RepID=UPI00222403A2|nr:S-methyl-5-thioribose-1-phosphate isomerase [Rhodoferax antarcticus]MCW2310938.1 methylthioribose-1-phosphate isomerase [Rhodoferax antarcticus]